LERNLRLIFSNQKIKHHGCLIQEVLDGLVANRWWGSNITFDSTPTKNKAPKLAELHKDPAMVDVVNHLNQILDNNSSKLRLNLRNI